MKNPRFELHRRLARQYHRNKRGDYFDRGILVRHDGILKGETVLEREFPDYRYDKSRWVADGLTELPSPVVSHRVAGT